MLQGIKLRANPTDKQKIVLSQWMGCARVIWNAKCSEERYYRIFAKKYYPLGTYAPVDQTYSQFKDKELTPYLYEAPSQILRNCSSNWFKTYINFLKGKCGRPKLKSKSSKGSIHLTKEMFNFKKCTDGVTRLFIGTKTKNIGFLSIKNHKSYKLPQSIYIKKLNNNYWVSFCYDEDSHNNEQSIQQDNLKHLQGCSYDYLQNHVVGVDRGVAIPVQCSDKPYDFTARQKASKAKKAIGLKRYQRKLSRQIKDSKRRLKTKHKIAKFHEKIANIRNDFCHKTSHAIVNDNDNKVIILEDLKTKNMTKKSKPKQDNNSGKWLKNGGNAKSGLNRAILDKGWHKLETYIKYKSYKAGKAWFKISANYTSQECAACGHTHPDNRKSQSSFICESCGYRANADKNAAMVIKKRAIDMILHSGTELSKRNVLLDTGRGATYKSISSSDDIAGSNESSKKKVKLVPEMVAA